MTSRESFAVRRPVIAGSWYPGSLKGLTESVQRYLSQVDQPLLSGSLRGLIVPHAGYAYSGLTAAYGYRQLEGCAADTVVLMGPSHRAWVGDYAVSTADAYQTPLGRVPVAQDFVADLAAALPLRRLHRDAEHSLEIQLPFLQHQLPGFDLVPVMMSADDPAAARRLALALVSIIEDREEAGHSVLLVASSDLHHIEDYDQVVRRDKDVIDAIADYDLPSLTALLTAPLSSVCGRMPILTLLHAAQSLGANATQILYHTNSGDVTGQRQSGQYTVGYLSAAVYRPS